MTVLPLSFGISVNFPHVGFPSFWGDRSCVQFSQDSLNDKTIAQLMNPFHGAGFDIGIIGNGACTVSINTSGIRMLRTYLYLTVIHLKCMKTNLMDQLSCIL